MCKVCNENIVVVCQDAPECEVEGVLLEDLYDHQLEVLQYYVGNYENGHLSPVSVVARSTTTGKSEVVETRAFHVLTSISESPESFGQWSYDEFRTTRLANYIKFVVCPLKREWLKMVVASGDS